MKNKKIIFSGSGYIIISVLLWVLGIFIANEWIKFSGLMFLACTFLPMPADTYVLFVSSIFSPLMIGIVGGIINSVAVIAEKKWLQEVFKVGIFEKFSVFFSGTKFTKYSKKYMFLSLVISAFSFIPFEAFRLVAIVKNYSNKKYFLATFIGRGSRYYVIALIGKQFFNNEWLYIAITLSLCGFLWEIIKIIHKKMKN